MSDTLYDMNKLRSQNVPPESLGDWMQVTVCVNVDIAYWLMRGFIDTYGVKVFWAYKDQQMMQKYGKILSHSEKIIYIDKMLQSEGDHAK